MHIPTRYAARIQRWSAAIQQCLERSDIERLTDFPDVSAVRDGLRKLQDQYSSFESILDALSSAEITFSVLAAVNSWALNMLHMDIDTQLIWGLTYLIYEVKP